MAPGVAIAATHQYMKDLQSGPQTFNTIEAMADDKLDANTSFTGRYAILGGLDGYDATSAFGLKHLFKIAKGVSASAAYEYLNGSIFDLTPSGMQFAQPYAVGQQGASALGISGGTSLSLSTTYAGSQYLKGSLRYEHRVSDQGSNTTYSFGGAGKLSDAVSLLAGFDSAGGANQTLGGLAASSDFRVGAAYRNPYTDTTNALLRYEIDVNPGITPATLLQGAGTWTKDNTLALEVLHDPSQRLELYGNLPSVQRPRICRVISRTRPIRRSRKRVPRTASAGVGTPPSSCAGSRRTSRRTARSVKSPKWLCVR